MKIKHSFLLFVLLLASACQRNISRNDDGSLSVETSIAAQALQEAVNAAIADPLIKEINVSLQSGYVLVLGERQRLNDSSKTDTLSFRLDLGVSDGKLTASISQALLDNQSLDQARVDHWNAAIAARLQKIGQKRDAVLQSVVVNPDGIQMTWQASGK